MVVVVGNLSSCQLLTHCLPTGLPTAYHLGMLRFFKNLTGSVPEDTFVDSTTSVIDAKNRRVAYWPNERETRTEIKKYIHNSLPRPTPGRFVEAVG